MAPSDHDKPTPEAPAERGVLASLPSTRPQRPSARRTAARDAAAKVSGATKQAAPRQPHSPPQAQRRPRAPRQPPPQQPRIPRQGFETEDEIAPGSTVHPPSRPELAAAVADLLGELAQGGLTAGGRLIKDLFGKLPGV